MRRQYAESRMLIIIGLLLVVMISGCSTAARYHEVDFGGQIGIVNGTFQMDGEVNVGVGAAPPHNFSDVRVVLYDEDGEVIKSVVTGRLSTDPAHGNITRHVNVTSSEIPEYVLIRSPDFWTDATTVQIAAYRRPSGNSNGYVRYEEYIRERRNQLTPE